MPTEWVCTDNDCLQFRRRPDDIENQPVFELVQINEYHDRLYHVAHGRIVFAHDVTEQDIEFLFHSYNWTYSTLLGDSGYAVVAEAMFETACTEYDTPDEYDTFEDAAKALGELIGVDVSQYLN